MDEVLGWLAFAIDDGIRHAGASELGTTPEAVVLKAMDRAREKYGEQDWSLWTFRAEPIPARLGAKPVHFEWRHGALVRAR
jgi:hypothetical protein